MRTPDQEKEDRDAKFLEERQYGAKRFGLPLEEVLWYHHGICYDRIGVTTKDSADKVTKAVEGQTVNGGIYHGMELGNQGHYKKEFGHDPEYFDVMC